MKTIGFIDYYLSEWHANNYPQWIAAASERLGYSFKVAYAWAEMDTSPIDNVTTDEWCEKMGAERCESIAELCEKSDYVIILAPSDPERHLAYAREALNCGKRTYIDKTFAPNYEEAAEIFRLGDEGGTEFFSTSALRYSKELDSIVSPRSIITAGGGSNLPEYIIHQVEMVVKKLGIGATSVSVEKNGDEAICHVRYRDDRQATMQYIPKHAFTMAADGGEPVAMRSDFFAALIEDILHFFMGAPLPFPREETLEVMKIREAVIAAYTTPGKEITIRG